MTLIHLRKHRAALLDPATVHRILTLSQTLYEHSGAAAVTFEQLSQASGTSVAQLVRHFESKDGLDTAVLNYCQQQQRALLDRLSEPTLKGRKVIDTVLGHCGQPMLGNPTARWLGRWALQATSDGHIPEALAGYYQQWHFIFMWCARVYHEKEQIYTVAAKALAMWHGFCFMAAIGQTVEGQGGLTQALRALFVPSPP